MQDFEKLRKQSKEIENIEQRFYEKAEELADKFSFKIMLLNDDAKEVIIAYEDASFVVKFKKNIFECHVLEIFSVGIEQFDYFNPKNAKINTEEKPEWKLFNDFKEELIQMINILLSGTKIDILEIRAYDVRNPKMQIDSGICCELFKDIRNENAFEMKIPGLCKKYWFFNSDEVELNKVNDTFKNLENTLKNYDKYEVYSLNKEHSVKETTMTISFFKNNVFFYLTVNTLLNEVVLKTSTRKNFLEKREKLIDFYADEFDIVKSFELKNFNLDVTIDELLRDEALKIIVSDGLWKKNLELYIKNMLNDSVLENGVLNFDNNSIFDAGYSEILTFYGQLNDCEGEELIHLEKVRKEQPELISWVSIRTKNNIDGIKVRLNNIQITFEFEYGHPNYPELLEYGVYEE